MVLEVTKGETLAVIDEQNLRAHLVYGNRVLLALLIHPPTPLTPKQIHCNAMESCKVAD